MTWTRSAPDRLPLALFAAALLFAAGCSKPPAYGSANAVIAVVDSALMEEVEPILAAAFEREVFTTRAETVFEITFVPAQSIGEFEKWRRIIVVEPLTDPVLVGDLVDADEGPVTATITDRWARGQTIWVLAAATPAATVELVRSRADSLYREIHDRYVQHQVDRMWASGRDSARYRSLVDSFDFGLVLPRLYDAAPGSSTSDSRVWYASDPRRVVSLHWVDRPAALSADSVLAIRRAWGREVFPDDTIVGALPTVEPADATGEAGPDAPDTLAAGAVAVAPVRASRTTLGGADAVRLQGLWRSRDGAAAGIFLTWGVACGDRLVLIDGNLFAPDRGKIPYLIQLEEIASTFRCAREPA